MFEVKQALGKMNAFPEDLKRKGAFETAPFTF
jgi:hypothetical protein